MTEPQDQGQATPQEPTTQDSSQQQDQPYFVARTKEEYERTFGPTRQEGRDALLKKLGFSKPTELEAFVNEYRQLQEDAKSETERERDARLEAEQELQKYQALADTRLIDSELRIALLNAGVPSDRIAAVAKLVERDGVAVEGNAVSGLEDAVTKTVEENPWVLGDSSTNQQTFRAADTSQVPTNSGDPDQAMGSWLNQILSNP